ncbi:MAG: hypothetical protein ACXV2F_06405 [Halobacteriota archaeon]
MFAECVRKGLRIAEIPITYRAREDQTKLSSLRDASKSGFFVQVTFAADIKKRKPALAT